MRTLVIFAFLICVLFFTLYRVPLYCAGLTRRALSCVCHGYSSGLLQVLALPVSALTVVLLVFLGFHTYLSCSGQTTKAIVRGVRAVYHNLSVFLLSWLIPTYFPACPINHNISVLSLISHGSNILFVVSGPRKETR